MFNIQHSIFLIYNLEYGTAKSIDMYLEFRTLDIYTYYLCRTKLNGKIYNDHY